jgi:hypothetical protein
MVEFDSTVEVTYDRDTVSEASDTVEFDLSKFEETDELNELIEVVVFSEVVEFSEVVKVCVELSFPVGTGGATMPEFFDAVALLALEVTEFDPVVAVLDAVVAEFEGAVLSALVVFP